MKGLRNRKTFRLQTKIILLIIGVLCVALAVTSFLIASETADRARESQKEKVMNIAIAVSKTELVIHALTDLDNSREIQTYTKAVQEDTDVDYIVIMDSNRIRRSHPVEKRIGEYFVGNDEEPAFRGERYTSTAEGTLGKSMRAFVPISNGTEQVGVVAVGILLDNVEEAVFRSQIIIYVGTGAGLIIGAIGAVFLSRRVSRSLHGLEPQEIGKLLKERDAMLASVREGIIAMNEKNEIVVANHTAMDIFHRAGLTGNPIGQQLDSYLPNSDLTKILLEQNIEYDQELSLNNIDIIINTNPIYVQEMMVGIIATFRERSELDLLAEQLTEARTYADTLRAQTHEFMNRLHVMSAMVHTRSYKELETYIDQISTSFQREIGEVSRLVKDPVLAGYIHNKLSQFRESGIEVELNGYRQLPVLKNTKKIQAIITIIGNLIDNANEAVAYQSKRNVQITINYIDGNFHFSIQDNGPGLAPSEKETIFKKGISTKGRNRGYGLYLVKKSLDELGGTLEIYSEEDEGTVFDLIIPYEGDNV
ncbi:DcuS/MalK family sensor histidine kinase [Oceanobacillus sp. Castelsardo]|uniref:DcuS/MalK family sensor histidine kinase n=1 Tax=Oceanobacillus sp. Castelsardo TaxID=1851204 RepID=UPI0008389DC2|nr:DcuS/MalK family sensor histidine kinase [Oceanobacillus sp. Castelsardo]